MNICVFFICSSQIQFWHELHDGLLSTIMAFERWKSEIFSRQQDTYLQLQQKLLFGSFNVYIEIVWMFMPNWTLVVLLTVKTTFLVKPLSSHVYQVW